MENVVHSFGFLQNNGMNVLELVKSDQNIKNKNRQNDYHYRFKFGL